MDDGATKQFKTHMCAEIKVVFVSNIDLNIVIYRGFAMEESWQKFGELVSFLPLQNADMIIVFL